MQIDTGFCSRVGKRKRTQKTTIAVKYFWRAAMAPEVSREITGLLRAWGGGRCRRPGAADSPYLQ